MKIQSDLVFSKHSNELIGFVDLGDEVSNAAAFDKPTTRALMRVFPKAIVLTTKSHFHVKRTYPSIRGLVVRTITSGKTRISAIAAHVLVFMVRGIASDLKYILGYFSTENMTSYQMMPIFWKAVSVLELSCNLCSALL